jgi:hypothetical protein
MLIKKQASKRPRIIGDQYNCAIHRYRSNEIRHPIKRQAFIEYSYWRNPLAMLHLFTKSTNMALRFFSKSNAIYFFNKMD